MKNRYLSGISEDSVEMTGIFDPVDYLVDNREPKIPYFLLEDSARELVYQMRDEAENIRKNFKDLEKATKLRLLANEIINKLNNIGINIHGNKTKVSKSNYR